MTLSFGEIITGFQSDIQDSKILRTLSTNPFIAALVIVIIILIILLINFRNAEIDNLCIMLIKIGIYSYAGVLLIMYLHNYYTNINKEEFGFSTGPNVAGITIGQSEPLDIPNMNLEKKIEERPSNVDQSTSNAEPSLPSFI